MAASYVISVRQASALPAASFRFYLTIDTLAVRLTVPLTGPVEDFHLQVGAPAGRTYTKGAAFAAPLFLVLYRLNNAAVEPAFWPWPRGLIPTLPARINQTYFDLSLANILDMAWLMMMHIFIIVYFYTY